MPKLRRTLPTLLGAFLFYGTLSGQVVLPLVAPEQAAMTEGPLRQVGELVEAAVARSDIAGAVVGVARGGRVGYLEPFGMQDIAAGTPMSERSLFRIYSMTKAVTAVAVMILHEEGHFELSDPVSTYLPEFERLVVLGPDGRTRPPTRPPTIEHLLLHTAGLSHRSSSEYREARVRARDITLEQFVENVVAVPLRADPGEEYRYSASPTVLGRLVEVWSGVAFDDFVRDRILIPLGMSDTGFWVEPPDVDRLATMYASDDGTLRPYQIEDVPFTERPALMEGAVGLVSTVPDFLRFAQMLLDGGELGGTRILQESTVAAMTRNGLPEAILRSRRGGSGWALGNFSVVVDPTAAEEGAHRAEYRWDGSAGTEFWVDPSTETIVVTMWQSSPANPNALRQRIRALVRQAVAEAP